LLATLGQRSDRSMLAAVSAESRKAAAAYRMQSVVAAFQEAVDDALGQLSNRLAL